MEQAKGNGKALSPNEISTFCAQIAMILRSGIPLQEGVSILMEDTAASEGKAVYETILNQLELGAPFYTALESAGCFPDYALHMAEIGERAGRLDQVMDSLCTYYEREETIGKNIRSAVTYPLIMIAMMVLVIGVLIVKVLPVFQQVFTQLGGEMSGFSKGVMSFGSVVGRYSTVIVALLALVGVGFFLAWNLPGFRAKLEQFGSRFFLTRNLYSKIASGRFASAMALTISSGLDMDESLEMVYKLVDNAYLRQKIQTCQKFVAEGASFSDALLKSEIFSGIYARMVAVGFKTGTMDSVMQKLADRYEEETDAQIGGMISILEPTLVAILSIVVGMILLSVMLPLMGIMSTIG